jgi:hypothetical protein
MNRNRQRPRRRCAFLLLTLSSRNPRASLNIDAMQSGDKRTHRSPRGVNTHPLGFTSRAICSWYMRIRTFACVCGLDIWFLNDDLSMRTLPFNRAITDQPQRVLVAKNYRLQITHCWGHSSTRREWRNSYYAVMQFIDVQHVHWKDSV